MGQTDLGITPFRALDYIKDDEALAAYVGAFVEQERERCAKLAEATCIEDAEGPENVAFNDGCLSAAAAIRKGE